MPVIAVYLRLSQEDANVVNTRDESNSISNQRMLIKEYIYNNSCFKGYDVIEFCDDGYSGTSMDRPGMNKMLEEVKKNRINCIIVKDLSRFSRDYIELGTYIDQILPFMGVRLISINDNYDSSSHKGSTAGIDTEFKMLLYDLYSKDISIKVKASLENKFSNGEYAYGQVPFGYQKSRTARNVVEINEKEAEIVRYIFSLAGHGKSSVQIAKQLYNENIPSITELRSRKVPDNSKACTWSHSAVRRILNNRFYLGEMSYGKSVRKFAGSKSRIKIPEKNWKVIPCHHTPLVSVETFEKAAYMHPVHSTKCKGSKNLFAGRLFCGGCGYSMGYKKKNCPERRYFWCRKHSLLQIPECCTNYDADILERLVLFLINRELVLKADAGRQTKNILLLYQSQITMAKKQIMGYKAEQKRIQAEKELLYESYALKQIPQEEYKEKAGSLAEKSSALHVILNDKQKELARLEEEKLKINGSIKQVIYYSGLEKLSQEAVSTFIKKIYVYKDKRTEIEWAFSE